MSRDILYVVEEMLDELIYTNEDPILLNIQQQLMCIQDKIKTTAPEAMFLRWSELDKIVDYVRMNGNLYSGAEKVISAYIRKWN